MTTESEDVQDTVSREIAELQNYEQFLDQLVGESAGNLFKPETQDDAIEQLVQLMAEELPVGTDGTNAIESLSGIINDEELADVFRELADVNPESDARSVIKDYIKIKDEENGTDLLSQIDSSAAPASEPAPAEEPAPASIERNFEGNAFAQAVQKAKAAGMKPGDKFKVGDKEVTLQDAISMAGLQIEDFFGTNNDEKHQGRDEISEFVQSMFDRETGNFPKGETGVLIAVEKQFGEGAVNRAQSVMQNLVSMSETYRIKKLSGLV